MQRKYLIIPNAIATACAVILFHRSFLAGHITWIGSLVTLAPLLALAHCAFGNTPRILTGFAAILNAILFFACGYAFLGTVSMLAKAGALGWPFYFMAGVLWIASLGMVLLKGNRANALFACLATIMLVTMGALGLYARTTGWMPWMTASLFAALIAVAGLNTYLLGIFPILDRRNKSKPSF